MNDMNTIRTEAMGVPLARRSLAQIRITKDWQREARLLIREHCTTERLTQVLESLHAQALNGSVQAAAIWLDRCVGKSDQKIIVEHGVDPSSVRAAIETLTRLGMADRVPPGLMAVVDEPREDDPLHGYRTDRYDDDVHTDTDP